MTLAGIVSKRLSAKQCRIWAYRWGSAGIRNAIRSRLRPVVVMDHPSRTIRLYADSDVEWRIRRRACDEEPDTVDWIERYVQPSDTFYDIAANVGVYSLIAARVRAARVYAFEPSIANIAKLAENAELNGLRERIIPFAVAVGETTGLAYLQEVDARLGSGLRRLASQPDGVSSCVPVCRLDDCLDWFSLPLPAHMKIDVDGDEGNILRGAARILAAESLRSMLIEVDFDRRDAQDTLRLLTGCGFVEMSRRRRRRNSWNLLMLKKGKAA